MKQPKSKRGLRWAWLSVVIILLDQVVKYLVSDSLNYLEPLPLFDGLNLTLVHNTGAAFSLLSNAGGWQRWFFMGLSSAVVVALLVWLYSLPGQRLWLSCSLALILGGAVGNLVDRTRFGYVVDFIDVYYKSWHFPAFNVADSAITVGAIMLIIDTFWFDNAVITTREGGRGGS